MAKELDGVKGVVLHLNGCVAAGDLLNFIHFSQYGELHGLNQYCGSEFEDVYFK